MATTHVRSLAVAAESTFASIDAATGLPSASGLTFAVLECERASISFDGQEHEAHEREDGRASAYHLPPEPVTMWASGSRVRRRTGTVSVRYAWRGIGASTAYATHAAMPGYLLLASGMGSHTPDATSDTVAASSSTANNTRWTPTTVGSFNIGEGVAVDIAGRKEFSFVTDVVDDSPDLVYASPGFSTDLSDEVVWLCNTLYGALGTSTLGDSVCIRADGDGWRWYGYGGRMESFSIEVDNRCVYVNATIRVALFQDDHGNASVSDPTRADGAIAHMLGSYAIVTGAIGTTNPAELARATVDLDAFAFTYTNTLAPKGRSDDLAGISDLEVVNFTAEVSLTLATPSTTYDPYFLNQTEVSVLVGAGPVGQGNGCAFYLPAAHLTRDASVRDLGGDLVRQVLTFRPGRWALDDATTAPARTPVRIAFPNKTAA